MKNPPSQQKRKALLNFVQGMMWLFDTQHYDWCICYMKESDGYKTAQITYKTDYREITICIYPSFWNQHDKVDILVHELCHMPLMQMKKRFSEFVDGTRSITKEDIQDLNEAETSHMQQVLSVFLAGGGQAYKEAYNKAHKVLG